jgi:hypothetical protein
MTRRQPKPPTTASTLLPHPLAVQRQAFVWEGTEVFCKKCVYTRKLEKLTYEKVGGHRLLPPLPGAMGNMGADWVHVRQWTLAPHSAAAQLDPPDAATASQEHHTPPGHLATFFLVL